MRCCVVTTLLCFVLALVCVKNLAPLCSDLLFVFVQKNALRASRFFNYSFFLLKLSNSFYLSVPVSLHILFSPFSFSHPFSPFLVSCWPWSPPTRRGCSKVRPSSAASCASVSSPKTRFSSFFFSLFPPPPSFFLPLQFYSFSSLPLIILTSSLSFPPPLSPLPPLGRAWSRVGPQGPRFLGEKASNSRLQVGFGQVHPPRPCHHPPTSHPCW